MKYAFILLCLCPLASFAAPRFAHTFPVHPNLVGHTRAEIHARFVATIERNLIADPSALSRLSERELVGLQGLYAIRGGQALQPLLSAHAQQRGFGRALPNGPTVDMTIDEIYYEFRTAPGASLSVPGALYETFVYAGLALGKAFAGGYAVGTVIYNTASTIDPEVADHIGEYIDAFGEGVAEFEGGSGDSSESGPGGIIREF